jgi:hypothetical protein
MGKIIHIFDTYTGPVEPLKHKKKGWSYANEPEIKELIDKGYRFNYTGAIKHKDKLQ